MIKSLPLERLVVNFLLEPSLSEMGVTTLLGNSLHLGRNSEDQRHVEKWHNYFNSLLTFIFSFTSQPFLWEPSLPEMGVTTLLDNSLHLGRNSEDQRHVEKLHNYFNSLLRFSYFFSGIEAVLHRIIFLFL